MTSVGRLGWLTSLLGVVVVAAACSTNGAAPPTASPTPGDDPARRQVLDAYEQFWTVNDAAFARPSAQDWEPRLREVASGQALDDLRRDVDNYAGLPAHTEGTVTRAPSVAAVSGSSAEVLDCIDLGDSRLVADSDGRVLDDLTNRVPRYRYRAGLVLRDGRWLVDRTTPLLDQPC